MHQTHPRIVILAGSIAALLPALSSAQFWEVDNQWIGAASSQTGRRFASAVAVGDFDGDGMMDLAIGAPDWDYESTTDAGRIEVYKGSRDRGQLPLTTWSAIFSGIENGRYGHALAAGDFDGDGRDELAIGFPGFNLPQITLGGQVILRGFNEGSWGDEGSLHQDDWFNGSTNIGETGDWFGATLAVGDFNDDGYDDLAVGVPFEDLGADANVGMIHVYHGSPSGLSMPATRSFAAGLESMLGDPADNDNFGTSLAAGDFTGDGYDDLAIGAPYRDPGGAYNAGQVHVLRGSSGGLSTADQQLVDGSDYSSWTASSLFGFALAAADFNQDPLTCGGIGQTCRDDLAIGVPGEDIWTMTPTGPVVADMAGVVVVAYGSSGGISTSEFTILSQDEAYGSPESGDFFGAALAAGQANRSKTLASRYADLVVGVPTEDVGGTGLTDDGFIHVFFGSAAGIDGDPTQPEQPFNLRQGFKLGPAANNDRFGSVLALGDLDGDGYGDLVIGIPEKDYFSHTNTGGALVLYGGLFADGFDRGTAAGWSAVMP